MSVNKKHIINERRSRVAKLYLEGWPQYKIADEVKVSQSQISRDLKYLSQQWQQSSMVNIDRIKARELAKIDELERKYYEGWNRSIRVQSVKKEREMASGDGKITRETSTEKRRLVGDPRFLDGILKCVAKREEILGYGAPSKKSIDATINVEQILSQAPEAIIDTILNELMKNHNDERQEETED